MITDYDTLKTADPSDPAAQDGLGDFSIAIAPLSPLQDLDTADDQPLELTVELDGVGEELSVPVIPRRADEFTCCGCYLVQHNSRAARRSESGTLCPECA